MEASKNYASLFGGCYNKDLVVFGVYYGDPCLVKLPYKKGPWDLIPKTQVSGHSGRDCGPLLCLASAPILLIT